MRRFVLLLPALFLTACTMGRDYKRPAIETPANYRGADPASGAQSLADLQWFELFQDPVLTGLVANALEHNFDLRMAAERVLQARALYRVRRADRFPSVDATGGLVAARASQTGANRAIPRGADTDVTYTEAGFSLGWELDVWGRLRRLTEAARAQYLATEEARRGVITTLVADVTQT